MNLMSAVDEKLKILVLMQNAPFPLTNGVNLRIFNFLKCLEAKCVFDLACYTADNFSQELSEIFQEVIVLPQASGTSNQSRWQRLKKKVSSGALYNVNENATTSLKGLVPNYDIVLSTTQLLPHLDFRRSTPLVVDIIDDAVLQQWRELSVTPGVKGKLRKLYYMALHYLFERRFCSGSYISAALITSEVDAKTFLAVSSLKTVQVIQNGVDTDYFKPLGVPEEDDIVVFEGNMAFDQNIIGAKYFCDHIFPLILKERPEAQLLLVGRDPTREVLDLANRPGVSVTGSVEDIRPYIARAAVFVCPLLSGGGIKNKILQAWSMSKACVATTRSVGGLAVEHEKNIIVRDNASEFAAAVIELMGDDERRQKIGRNARDTILANYSWEKKADELYNLLRSQLDEIH